MLKKIFMSSFKIFTLFGIPVYLHSTFLIMMALITIFNWPTGLLFLAAFTFVLMHEFGHCLAAKWCNVKVKSIIMLPIGGLAGIDNLNGDPQKELLITFAGPFVNAALVSFFSIPLLLFESGEPIWLYSTLVMGWWINVMLFVFNMIPCFPMDGGRILRATLCIYWGDLIRATKVAVIVGRILACMMIGAGLYLFQIMWIIIGVVIILLAEVEYRGILQSVSSVRRDDLAKQLRELDED